MRTGHRTLLDFCWDILSHKKDTSPKKSAIKLQGLSGITEPNLRSPVLKLRPQLRIRDFWPRIEIL